MQVKQQWSSTVSGNAVSGNAVSGKAVSGKAVSGSAVDVIPPAVPRRDKHQEWLDKRISN